MSLKIVSRYVLTLMKAPALLLLPLLLCALSACEQLGIADPAKLAEAKDAEGKAIGGACRHSGRALEDCYELNKGALKASVFAGWKDMNDYMAQNKIDSVKPEVPVSKPEKAADEEASAEDSAPAKKSSRKRVVKADSGAH